LMIVINVIVCNLPKILGGGDRPTAVRCILGRVSLAAMKEVVPHHVLMYLSPQAHVSQPSVYPKVRSPLHRLLDKRAREATEAQLSM